jgi:hypothetical protein
MSDKYPRTYHLPYSPGATNDDKIAPNVDFLLNTPLVITEKCDGSNLCMDKNNIFARTHSGPPKHASFNMAKSIHASIKHELIDGLDYFGEYCYAKHSIEYTELPGYFLLFGIRTYIDGNGWWKSWQSVKSFAKSLNIPTVPELEKLTVSSEKELQKVIEKHMNEPSVCGGEREGVVVRRVEAFSVREFSKATLKNVRKNHVQTSEHWMNQEITPNKLK